MNAMKTVKSIIKTTMSVIIMTPLIGLSLSKASLADECGASDRVDVPKVVCKYNGFLLNIRYTTGVRIL